MQSGIDGTLKCLFSPVASPSIHPLFFFSIPSSTSSISFCCCCICRALYRHTHSVVSSYAFWSRSSHSRQPSSRWLGRAWLKRPPPLCSALLSVRFISHRRTIAGNNATSSSFQTLFFLFFVSRPTARAFQWATTETMTDRWLLSAPAIKQSPDCWRIPRSFPVFPIWKCFGFCRIQYR